LNDCGKGGWRPSATSRVPRWRRRSVKCLK
jgi:hypothetical protein